MPPVRTSKRIQTRKVTRSQVRPSSTNNTLSTSTPDRATRSQVPPLKTENILSTSTPNRATRSQVPPLKTENILSTSTPDRATRSQVPPLKTGNIISTSTADRARRSQVLPLKTGNIISTSTADRARRSQVLPLKTDNILSTSTPDHVTRSQDPPLKTDNILITSTADHAASSQDLPLKTENILSTSTPDHAAASTATHMPSPQQQGNDFTETMLRNIQTLLIGQQQRIEFLEKRLLDTSVDTTLPISPQSIMQTSSVPTVSQNATIRPEVFNLAQSSSAPTVSQSATIRPEVSSQLVTSAVSAAVQPIMGESPVSSLARCSVSGSLPLGGLVSDELKARIFGGLYVDFSLLIQSNPQPNYHLTVDLSEQSPTLCLEQTNYKKFLKFPEWCEAFRIFVAIRTSVYPGEVSALMKYQQTISDIQRKGGSWYRYDKTFREALPTTGLAWDQLFPELYLECLQSKVRSRGRLQLELGTCFRYQRGNSCYGCEYSHACAQCGGAHPAIRCTGNFSRAKSSNFRSFRPTDSRFPAPFRSSAPRFQRQRRFRHPYSKESF